MRHRIILLWMDLHECRRHSQRCDLLLHEYGNRSHKIKCCFTSAWQNYIWMRSCCTGVNPNHNIMRNTYTSANRDYFCKCLYYIGTEYTQNKIIVTCTSAKRFFWHKGSVNTALPYLLNMWVPAQRRKRWGIIIQAKGWEGWIANSCRSSTSIAWLCLVLFTSPSKTLTPMKDLTSTWLRTPYRTTARIPMNIWIGSNSLLGLGSESLYIKKENCSNGNSPFGCGAGGITWKWSL